MPSPKAGAASLSKVRRPAAPIPAGKHSTGVSHSRQDGIRVSSVSGTRSVLSAVLAFVFIAVVVTLGVTLGVLASRWPMPTTAVGLLVLFAAAVAASGGAHR